jgi:hypothetical protein
VKAKVAAYHRNRLKEAVKTGGGENAYGEDSDPESILNEYEITLSSPQSKLSVDGGLVLLALF